MVSLRDYDLHALGCCSAPAILAGADYLVRAFGHGRQKMAELPVRLDASNGFTVDNQSRSGLGASDDLDHIALQNSIIHLEQHFLLFTLYHQREFRRLTLIARGVFSVDGANPPVIIARIEPDDVQTFRRCFLVHDDFAEHGGGAGLKFIRLRGSYRLPGKVDRVAFWIRYCN